MKMAPQYSNILLKWVAFFAWLVINTLQGATGFDDDSVASDPAWFEGLSCNNPQLQALNRAQKEDIQEILIKLAEEVKAYESSLVKGCVADEVGSASFIPMGAYSEEYHQAFNKAVKRLLQRKASALAPVPWDDFLGGSHRLSFLVKWQKISDLMAILMGGAGDYEEENPPAWLLSSYTFHPSLGQGYTWLVNALIDDFKKSACVKGMSVKLSYQKRVAMGHRIISEIRSGVQKKERLTGSEVYLLPAEKLEADIKAWLWDNIDKYGDRNPLEGKCAAIGGSFCGTFYLYFTIDSRAYGKCLPGKLWKEVTERHGVVVGNIMAPENDHFLMRLPFALWRGWAPAFLSIAFFVTLFRAGVFTLVREKRRSCRVLWRFYGYYLITMPVGWMMLFLTAMLFNGDSAYNEPHNCKDYLSFLQRENLHALLCDLLFAVLVVTLLTLLCDLLCFIPSMGRFAATIPYGGGEYLLHAFAYVAAGLCGYLYADLYKAMLWRWFRWCYTFRVVTLFTIKFLLSKVEMVFLLTCTFFFTFPSAYFRAPTLRKSWKGMSYGVIVAKVIAAACIISNIPHLLLESTVANALVAVFALWCWQEAFCYVDLFVCYLTNGSGFTCRLLWIVSSAIGFLSQVWLLTMEPLPQSLLGCLSDFIGGNSVPSDKALFRSMVLAFTPVAVGSYLLVSFIDVGRWIGGWEASERVVILKKGEGKTSKPIIFKATASQEREEGHKGDDVAIVEEQEELLEGDNFDSESLTMATPAQQSGSHGLLYGVLLLLAAAVFLLIRAKRGRSPAD